MHMNSPIPLEQIEAAIWQELERAPRLKDHAWRTPVFATVDERMAPQARVVVLRHVEPQSKRLHCFTDKNSSKYAQILCKPLAQWVFWCPALKWQLRLSTRVRVETDAVVLQPYWDRLRGGPTAGDYLLATAGFACLKRRFYRLIG
jgi:pyridoxamine 5'-phosphate oxidase